MFSFKRHKVHALITKNINTHRDTWKLVCTYFTTINLQKNPKKTNWCPHKLTVHVHMQRFKPSSFTSPFTDKPFVSWEILSFPPRNVVISFYHDVTKNQTNPSTPTVYTLVHTSILSISFKLRSRVTPFKTFSETEWRPPRLFSSKHITARHYAAEEGHLSSQLTQINGPHPFPRPDFQ